MLTIIRKLWAIIDPRSKRALIALGFVMVFGAGFEALGIGLVLPAIQVLSDPGGFTTHPFLARLSALAGNPPAERLVALMLILLAVAFTLKNAVYLLIQYMNNRITSNGISRLTVKMFRIYIDRPYLFHLLHNSAELFRNAVTLPHGVFGAAIGPAVNLATELLVVVAIAALLLFVDPAITVVASVFLGVITWLYYVAAREPLRAWGAALVELEQSKIQGMNEAMSAIREIRLAGGEDFVSGRFRAINDRWADYRAMAHTVEAIPRPLVEICTVVGLLAAVGVFGSGGAFGQDMIAKLGLFAVAAVRLMPSGARIAHNLGALKLNAAGIDTLHRETAVKPAPSRPDTEPEAQSPVRFEREITLRNVAFRYPGSGSETGSIDAIDLSIRKGESVAFVGASGAGKTTLVNLITGLLAPAEGEILVDGRRILTSWRGWQSKIGFIPQDIYLLDDTLRRNIAFAHADEEIDEDRIRKVVAIARLDVVAAALPDGLDTMVGERGARLSGGERQRVAIARALYDDPEILILDEATSSLDTVTEAEIARAVHMLSGDKTVIMIAHRISTVKDCDRIFLMEGGRIVGVGTFESLARDNSAFQKLIAGALVEKA